MVAPVPVIRSVPIEIGSETVSVDRMVVPEEVLLRAVYLLVS